MRFICMCDQTGYRSRVNDAIAFSIKQFSYELFRRKIWVNLELKYLAELLKQIEEPWLFMVSNSVNSEISLISKQNCAKS